MPAPPDTQTVERADYEAPIHHAEIVEVAAVVAGVGRRSVAVDVEVAAEALLSGERRRGGSGRFTLVAIEEDARPVAWGDRS